MTDEAARVKEVFVASYGPYVRARLEAIGAGSVDGIDHAIEQGRVWLDEALTELISVRFVEQRRGPLELFQEAMVFPTRTLEAVGIEPVLRDEVVANALPGDRFGLAPAASHEIGEDAWHAHVGWGAAKAAALRGRAKQIGLLSRNLMDTSKLTAALEKQGHSVVSVRDEVLPAGLELVLVDLDHTAARVVIEAAVSDDIACIAYGPHVDVAALEEAKRLGVDEALPRSKILSDPDKFARRLLG